jgi:CrcB protein
MKILLLIGTGSFIGGISRYLLSQFVRTKLLSSFPFGTLAVNIIGCLLIGFLLGLSDKGTLAQGWRLFLITGVLGGFTTFSAFSGETVSLLKDGQFWYAAAYVSASLFLGLTATYIGNITTKII